MSMTLEEMVFEAESALWTAFHRRNDLSTRRALSRYREILRHHHFLEAADALDQRNDHLQALLEAKAKEQGASCDRDHYRAWKDAARFLRALTDSAP